MPAAAFQLQILTASDYDAVRAALDVSLDVNVLPDAVIESPAYGPSAESEILARDANALTYESGGTANPIRWARVRRAAILLTAARLAPALPNIAGEALGDYHVTLKPWDWLQRAATLRGMANRELSTYLNDPINGQGQVTVLPAAWLGRGGRAR